MKIIDIFNKISKGEEVKFKIIDTQEDYYCKEDDFLRDINNQEAEWFLDSEWLNKEVEILDDEGNVKPKTIGKLLDEKVNIQGMFTICIRSMYDNGNYIFRLKTNGQDCVKTPIGLFDEEQMENDLKVVDEKIREYYDLDKKEGEK